MASDWVYVINDGGGVPKVVRGSNPAISVSQVQPGEYVVQFPAALSGLTCVATLNNSVGAITALPGDNSGLPANLVRVLTLSLDNQLMGSLDFSLAVFYESQEVGTKYA